MTLLLDETHDIGIGSWVPSARRAAGDFPLQNLPLGVFRRRGLGEPRIGVAIGDRVLDLHRTTAVGALGIEPGLYDALQARTLNPLLALGRRALRAVRHAVFGLLRDDSRLPRPPDECLVPLAEVELLLPVEIGDYTDFYASIHHATNVGTMLRPEQPLLPNYKWVPIGYHGRASSVVPSGTPVRRPVGQLPPAEVGPPSALGPLASHRSPLTSHLSPPELGPTRSLDYECEIGAWVGRGNPLGTRVPIGQAEEHLAGLCLVNDWSARDIQRWEYQPLGPFLAKSFATTVSPWVVTLDGLEPFRTARPDRPPGDPRPLAYLDEAASQSRSGFAIELEVWLSSARMREESREPVRLSRAEFAGMYWSLAQLLTHHTSNGCNLRPGDLLASGTVSGPDRENRGCLLELTWRGTEPITLPTGEVRRFLGDGDEVIIRGRASRPGFATIGFGECRGIILPAEELTP
ncbi:MAG: fumarylacetoacetase [Gemmatimonadales bacterium]